VHELRIIFLTLQQQQIPSVDSIRQKDALFHPFYCQSRRLHPKNTRQ